MMYFLFYIAIEVIPSMILFTPLLILWQTKICKRQKMMPALLIFLFTGYILSVFSVTGIPAIGTFSPQFQINLIPLSGLERYSVQYILNIFLFLPLGLLLPILWEPFRKFRNSLLAGFGLSLFIEVSQLFTFRSTDIDDLIMNTLGTVIGFLIIRFCIHMNWIHSPISGADSKSNIREFFILLGISLFIWVFINPFITKLFVSFLL